jgi:hypothetical protein
VGLKALVNLFIQFEPEAVEGHQLVRIAGLGPELLVFAPSGLTHGLQHRPGVSPGQQPAQQVFPTEL